MFASFPISCPIKMIADACAASFSICCSCITQKRMQWMHFSCYERTSQYTLSLSISSSVTNHLRQCRHRKCLLYQENFLKVLHEEPNGTSLKVLPVAMCHHHHHRHHYLHRYQHHYHHHHHQHYHHPHNHHHLNSPAAVGANNSPHGLRHSLTEK